MNILVTGGAGFIGSNLVHYLLNEAENDLGITINKVVTYDKLTYAGNLANLESLEGDERHVIIQGDICDGASVAAVLRKYKIGVVMHLAAESHVDRSIDSPEEFIETNVLGTFQLLNASKAYRDEYYPNLENSHSANPEFLFLHVSTDEVYGSLGANDPAFSETTAYAPNSPYSASKAASDHLVRAYYHTYGLPVVTTNCSNNYGPYQFPEKLLPLMIQKIMRGEKLPVYGDGKNIRDWLYVRDHCRGLVMAMTKGISGETYTIGGNCEMKNIDVVHALIRTVHELVPDCALKPAEDLISFVSDRPGHDQRYAIDANRISNELGWKPEETFASGLKKTVKWYIDHQKWVSDVETGEYRGQRLGTLAI
ncbi:MAG: dTDP-glucose 4,6-dehydratase [Akkermansiaceae bacterium]